MIKLLKDKIEIEVSESTNRRALQKHKYHNVGHKICRKKYLERAAQKIRLVSKTS